MNKKLNFYIVDNEYLNYLRKIDEHVPYNKETINNISNLKNYIYDKILYSNIISDK